MEGNLSSSIPRVSPIPISIVDDTRDSFRERNLTRNSTVSESGGLSESTRIGLGIKTAADKDFETSVELTMDEHAINNEWHRIQVPVEEHQYGDRRFPHIQRYARGYHEPMLEDYFFVKRAFFKWSWDNVLFKLKTFLFLLLTVEMLCVLCLSVGSTLFCIFLKVSFIY